MKKKTSVKKSERLDGDAYYTPEPLARAMCLQVAEVIAADGAWEENLRILEPSVGRGSIARAALEEFPGCHMTGIDVAESDEARSVCDEYMVMDFADYSLPRNDSGYDLIIGNPPYGKLGREIPLAELHVRHALTLLRQGGYLAFLLRSGFKATAPRYERIWRPSPPRYVFSLTNRPSFTGGGTDRYDYDVIVWKKGHTGPYYGGWMPWSEVEDIDSLED